MVVKQNHCHFLYTNSAERSNKPFLRTAEMQYNCIGTQQPSQKFSSVVVCDRNRDLGGEYG